MERYEMKYLEEKLKQLEALVGFQGREITRMRHEMEQQRDVIMRYMLISSASDVHVGENDGLPTG